MAERDGTTHDNHIPDGYLYTAGSTIVGSDGTVVRLAGVNWYGFDCSAMVVGGLDYQTVDDLCRTVVRLGFNVVRLPFCVQAVQSNPTITDYLDANPSLVGKTALEIMDVVVGTCEAYGLKIILDSHRADAGWSTQSNGLWYTQAYPEDAWLSAWQTIVQRYAGTSTVIGCDLHNEPGAPPLDGSAWPRNNGSEWGYDDPAYDTETYPADWASAAQRAGNAILRVNPELLIVVEGVRYDPAGPWLNGGHELYWPGGNLMGVGSGSGHRAVPVPITLDVANRLVYSAHDYGPDMYSGLAWCRLDRHGRGTGASPAACNTVWDQTWGYIAKNGIAPVLLGEFGTVNGYKPDDPTPQQDYTDVNDSRVAQGYWFSYLTDYIRAGGISWCYWGLNGTQSPAPGRNPSLPDWYGVLDPSWADVASTPLMAKLHTIQ